MNLLHLGGSIIYHSEHDLMCLKSQEEFCQCQAQKIHCFYSWKSGLALFLEDTDEELDS
jgi:hypothetical protein